MSLFLIITLVNSVILYIILGIVVANFIHHELYDSDLATLAFVFWWAILIYYLLKKVLYRGLRWLMKDDQ